MLFYIHLKTKKQQTFVFKLKIRSNKPSWCGREDLNLHGIAPITTSTLRVYQFRHGRMKSGHINTAAEQNMQAVLRNFRYDTLYDTA